MKKGIFKAGHRRHGSLQLKFAISRQSFEIQGVPEPGGVRRNRRSFRFGGAHPVSHDLVEPTPVAFVQPWAVVGRHIFPP
jgi:hypothetical protein